MHGLRGCLALWLAAYLAQAREVSLRDAPVELPRQTVVRDQTYDIRTRHVKERQTDKHKCTGTVHCPCYPHQQWLCSDDNETCPILYGFPGMEYLGRAVDMKKYHTNLVETLTQGKTHTLAECILDESYVSQDMDFNLIFRETFGTDTCLYTRPNATALPHHVGTSQASSDLSVSAFSKASSMSLDVGFAASEGLVSISGAFSMQNGHSSSGSSFSGSADTNNVDWQLSLQPHAEFNGDILKGRDDYDGSVAARLSYTNLFKKVGFYFVTQVTTGGNFKLMQTVTKTASANSSQYAYDFKVHVAFVTAHASGGGSNKDDSFHRNSQSNLAAVGGDDNLRANLLSYLPVIENETIDTKHWQKDYGNWLESIPANPILMGFKVDHIRNWIPGGDANPIVDNLRLAYDELESGLHADRLTLLRIQYGLKEDFDRQAVDAQFIELPTELKNLPSNLPDNTGFSTQYDPQHSCPSAMSGARNYLLGRTLRYTEHCNSTTNLIACGGHSWCDLLTNSNMGMTPEKALNAELWMRVSFVAGAGNEIQTIDFKPCGYGVAWAVYWNEHQPYSHNRTRQAKVVGPYYSSVEGGGKAQQMSDAAKDLFPCTADNSMGGFTDGTDPACCDSLSANESYIASQEVGCPAECSGHGECVFPPEGPLYCRCDPGYGGHACQYVIATPAPTPAPTPATPAPTPAPPSDADLLMKFAAHITPTPRGWGGPGLCWEWYGVTCDDAGNVRKLDLGTYEGTVRFSGTVDLTALPSGLTWLRLDDSDFSGSVDLTALPSGLTYLSLGFTKFSGTVDLTALPSSLTNLYLGRFSEGFDGGFSGTVDLTALPSGLESLHLGGNEFSGTPDLTALPSGLWDFDLSYNQFSGSGSFPTTSEWCGDWFDGAQVCGGEDAIFSCTLGIWFCD